MPESQVKEIPHSKKMSNLVNNKIVLQLFPGFGIIYSSIRVWVQEPVKDPFFNQDF